MLFNPSGIVYVVSDHTTNVTLAPDGYVVLHNSCNSIMV